MKKYLLDTNVVLRFLLEDNVKLARQAKNYFQNAKDKKIIIFCPEIVFFELVFVLEKVYDFKKETVIDRLKSLLLTPYIEIQSKSIFLQALELYRVKNVDFVDVFLYILAKLQSYEILSFDKDFRKLKG